MDRASRSTDLCTAIPPVTWRTQTRAGTGKADPKTLGSTCPMSTQTSFS